MILARENERVSMFARRASERIRRVHQDGPPTREEGLLNAEFGTQTLEGNVEKVTLIVQARHNTASGCFKATRSRKR